MRYRYLLVALSIILFSLESSAQRTAEGRYFLDVRQSATYHSVLSGGVSFGLGLYGRSSYMQLSVSGNDYMQSVSGNMSYDYLHLVADYDWMWRAASTSSRSFNFYMGGGLFLGAEVPQVFRNLPSEFVLKDDKTVFLYGIQPKILFEYYVTMRSAILLELASPVSFGVPQAHVWSVKASLGARFVLKH